MSEVKIIHARTDPACATRISVGGDERIGYYCTYRGDRKACLDALAAALAALATVDPEPPIRREIPDIGENRN